MCFTKHVYSNIEFSKRHLRKDKKMYLAMIPWTRMRRWSGSLSKLSVLSAIDFPPVVAVVSMALDIILWYLCPLFTPTQIYLTALMSTTGKFGKENILLIFETNIIKIFCHHFFKCHVTSMPLPKSFRKGLDSIIQT